MAAGFIDGRPLDRDLQYVFGVDAVQRAFPGAGRIREARCVEAGGFPLEFPVMSLGETQLRPTAMLFRNLASMDVEESIRGESDGWRGVADGLRQNHSFAADGRGFLRSAD